MIFVQKQIRLRPRSRGFHLVTDEVTAQMPELARISSGLAHFFLQHTSASLTLNENADPDVRADFETYFSDAVPEKGIPFRHTTEGSDDMPAHLKTSMLGVGVTVPVSGGRLALGTWQGLYLGEHRRHGGARSVFVTAWGAAAPGETGGRERGSEGQ